MRRKKNPRPSLARAYDTEMIRDFLDHLTWEVRISIFELRNGGTIHPELSEQLQRFITKRQTNGLIFADSETADANGDKAAYRAALTRLRERQLERLERSRHAPNNIAKPSLIPDSVISRTRLRPKYGQGWQPRLDPRPRQADGRGLGEEEST